MAYPQVIELFDSGRGGLTTNDDGTITRDVELRWLLNGFNSYLAAETKGQEIAPLEITGHRRKNLQVDSLGNGWWTVSAGYSNPAIQDDGGQGDDNSGGEPASNTIAFDTTGGTEHVTQAYSGPDKVGQSGITGQLGYHRPGEQDQVPDYEGAIGVNGNTVTGVDKVVPVWNFQETWTFPAKWVVDSFIYTLYSNTGKVNSGPFRCFKFGEVLFLGARGELTRGASAVAITFSFAARPNVSDPFKVGDVEVSFKGGWDYMDVQYEHDTDNSTLIKKPKFVFINTIYAAFDFSQLRIGTQFPAVYMPPGAFAGGAQ